MPPPPDLQLRPATPADAPTLAALPTQVFLGTYAADGARPDPAREALSVCSVQAFDARLREPHRRILLAERGEGLLGFAELLLEPTQAPATGAAGAELVRLYVQPRAQGIGIGRHLLSAAETATRDAGVDLLWLTAWDGNTAARAFYARCGYTDAGATTYVFEDRSYGNRVLVRRLHHVSQEF